MRADTVDLATIFGKPVRYLVPLFQRPYVWTLEHQWEPLWEDIQAVAERQLDDTPSNDSIQHFMGAVVFDQVLTSTGMIESRYVIDGQQRLTTLQLFIAAARSVALELELSKPCQMLEKLLFNDDFLVRKPEDRFKVVPTWSDRDAFQRALGGEHGADGNHLIMDAFLWFQRTIREWAVDGRSGDEIDTRFEALTTVLWKLLAVVSIDLTTGDNAQVIFETLNARGTPLLAADLIKNHLFQVAISQGCDIDALYERHWKPLDQDWWRAEVQQGRLRRPRLDILANYWLAMRLRHEVVSHQLFQGFKRYLADLNGPAEAVLADLALYAAVYRRLVGEPEGTPLGRFLYRLDTMEVTTAYPALLWMLGPDGLEAAEVPAALAAIESWLTRRMLVRATTKNYNSVFMALLRDITSLPDSRRPVAEDIVVFFAALRGESQFWPSDRAVMSALRALPVYTSLTRARLRMVLEALETHLYTGLTEKVLLGHDLTVEHVLPQEWRPNWPIADGADPSERDGLKHTIGNLTLVTGRLNPSMSNAGWAAKRLALRENSILKISTDLREAEVWDEPEIIKRTERLSGACLEVWPRPSSADGDEDADYLAITDGSRTAARPHAYGGSQSIDWFFSRPLPAGLDQRANTPSDRRESTPEERERGVAFVYRNAYPTFYRAVFDRLEPTEKVRIETGQRGAFELSRQEFEDSCPRIASSQSYTRGSDSQPGSARYVIGGVPEGLARFSANATDDLSEPNKSEEMRRLYKQGRTVSQVADTLGVSYGFAYGVRKRWLESETESEAG